MKAWLARPELTAAIDAAPGGGRPTVGWDFFLDIMFKL